MRCPTCVADGKEHEVRIENAAPKPGPPPLEYWDKFNRLHMHDDERKVMHIRCSNGHSFTLVFLSRCPCRICDWNLKPEIDGLGWPEAAKPAEGS